MEQVSNNSKNKEIIKDYLISSSGVTTIEDDTDIFETGLVNSLFVIQLVTFLEKQFGFKVVMDDMNMYNYNSINHIDEFVAKKLS